MNRAFRISAAIMFTFALLSGLVSAAQDHDALDTNLDGDAANVAVEDYILLLVDKTKLVADLRTWVPVGADSKVLQSFKIAIGKEEGDKQKEGDNRTPEGIYFTQTQIPDSKLPNKYGSLAIPLNFPNPIDQLEHKTGYGIWLHGVDDSERISEAKVTEGCVAFYNPDIAKLGSWLKPHQGVVVIASDLIKVNDEADIEVVTKKTQNWMAAWSERQVDRYVSFYHQNFTYKKMNLTEYRDYKSRVFTGYKSMSVKFNDIRVITHPKYALTIFNQDFNGDDRFISNGRKVLYWEKGENGDWYIKRETFEHRRFERLSYSNSALEKLTIKAEEILAPEKKKSASAK